MTNKDKTALLFGPYTFPALKAGGRAFRQVRGCVVVVTIWTGAPISWPRCRALETHDGGSGRLKASLSVKCSSARTRPAPA